MAGLSQGGNLYIIDNELIDTGGKLASHRNFLSEVLESYIHIMDYLTDNLEGAAVSAIKRTINQLRSIPSDIVESGMNLQFDCGQYVSEVDEADRYLY